MSSTDRIAADYSKLPSAVIARRAIGAMTGDHTVDAKFVIGDDTEPHVVKGNVDPATGDAKISYRHVIEDDPDSTTANEVRIHEGIGYSALPASARAELLADWYRFKLDDPDLSPPDIVVGSLVATSPQGAKGVTSWKQTIVNTFGPKTRLFTGTTTAAEAIPLLSIESATEKIKYEMWVDARGELRRLRWTLRPAGLATIQLQADFKDRHKSLVVPVPLKNVVDLADLIASSSAADSTS